MADATININAVDKTRAAFASVNRSMSKMSKATDGVKGQIMGAGFGLLGAGTIFDLVRKEVEETIRTIDDIPGVPDETIRSVEKMKMVFTQSKTAIRGFIAEGISKFAELGSGLGIALGAMVYGTDAAADALNALNEEAQAAVDRRAFEKLQKELEPLRRELKSVEDAGSSAMAKLYGTTLKGRDAYDALQGAMSRVSREMNALNGNETIEGMRRRIELTKEQTKIATSLYELEQKAAQGQKEAAKILGQGFEKAITSGEKLTDVIKQLGMDLMKLALRNTVTNPLVDFLGKSNFLGGIFKNFGGPQAAGGSVSSGKSYLVGEKGPEMFTPSSAGHIIPNNALGGSSGGARTVYNIDARGADRTGLARLEQMIRETQSSIGPIAVRSVYSAAGRGMI
jgi:hypothetical protein